MTSPIGITGPDAASLARATAPSATPLTIKNDNGEHGTKPAKPIEGPSFGQILRGLGDETARGEHLVARAVHIGASGKEASPAELIALQAGIYRYVEVVDLSSKLVDRVTSGIKGVVQQGGGG
jgi:hypothetical protein